MSDRELLQQALDALENHATQRTYAGGVAITNTAIALRKRLAQCDRCGKLLCTDGHIHTCSPQEPSAWGDALQDRAHPAEPMKPSTRSRARQEQEPVAHVDSRIHGWPDCFVMEPDPPHTSPLYTAPQRREWVGLTEEEMQACWDDLMSTPDYSRTAIYRAIEAALKERNA